MIKTKNKKCPLCNKKIKGYSAISRKDNKTEICSDCGVLEALESWLSVEEKSKKK